MLRVCTGLFGGGGGGENDIHGAMPPRGVCGGMRALTLLLVTSGVHKAPTLCV